jgi:aspartate/methionine/tyrosine aminotransferase
VLNAAHLENEISRIKRGHPYDVSAQGLLPARRAAITLFDQHYHFSEQPGLVEALSKNSVLISGGMLGLDFFARSMLRRAKKSGETPRFVHPDTSFDSWKRIVEDYCNEGVRGKTTEITTQPEHGLHLTAPQVHTFYDENPETYKNVWCLTPVGNPSGTSMTPLQLQEVCEAIVERDPKAVILLDSTYIRVLDVEKARALMAGIIRNPNIMNQVVFLESFSKTHGLCADRLSILFSSNPSLVADEFQNRVMSSTAGTPITTSAKVTAVAKLSPEQQDEFKKMHRLWAKELHGLFVYFKQFPHLFDEQLHIQESELGKPTAPYLFMKLKEGVTAKQVALETWCFGVETPMGSGNYIRFAVGAISEPTYAHYAEAEAA